MQVEQSTHKTFQQIYTNPYQQVEQEIKNQNDEYKN